MWGEKCGEALLSGTALTVWPNRHNRSWDNITTADCLLDGKLELFFEGEREGQRDAVRRCDVPSSARLPTFETHAASKPTVILRLDQTITGT